MNIDALVICQNHFSVRKAFFDNVLHHINNPELQAALVADGFVPDDGIFVNPDDAYKLLNSPKSRTRNWLIWHSAT